VSAPFVYLFRCGSFSMFHRVFFFVCVCFSSFLFLCLSLGLSSLSFVFNSAVGWFGMFLTWYFIFPWLFLGVRSEFEAGGDVFPRVWCRVGLFL